MPASFVFVGYSTFVFWFTAVTVAPFRTPPLLSSTTPVTDAVTDWPRTGEARPAASSIASGLAFNQHRLLDFMLLPLLESRAAWALEKSSSQRAAPGSIVPACTRPQGALATTSLPV